MTVRHDSPVLEQHAVRRMARHPLLHPRRYLVVGFFPPSNVESGSTLVYVVGMIVGTVLLSCPPFLFLATKGRLWARASHRPTARGIGPRPARPPVA